MNVLGVTLARGGSKGLPNKHLLDLCGKPVIAWTVEAALAARKLTHYLVCSDSDAIMGAAVVAGATAINRPAYLAADNTPTLPALQYAVRRWEEDTHKQADLVVEIRATSPLKTAQDIDEIVSVLEATGADSVIGVVKTQSYHPSRIKYLEDGYLRDFYPEPTDGVRQNLKPDAYVRNGTVYALRREWVMGPNARLFGHPKSLAFVMPPERSVNIDTESDLELCRFYMSRR